MVHELLDRARDAFESRVLIVSFTSLPVTSGFCSEPESANSLAMIFSVRMNQVWSWPVCEMYSSVPSVSKPGKSGGGKRLPVASSQTEEGPGMIRIPWRDQMDPSSQGPRRSATCDRGRSDSRRRTR